MHLIKHHAHLPCRMCLDLYWVLRHIFYFQIKKCTTKIYKYNKGMFIQISIFINVVYLIGNIISKSSYIFIIDRSQGVTTYNFMQDFINTTITASNVC